MKSLDGIKSGVYRVYTETSSYILNFNRMIAKRVPGGGLGVDLEAGRDVELTRLRADNEWFDLRGVYAVVGQIMHLDCKGISKDGDYTWRRTTIVRKIEKIDGRKKV